MLALPSVTGQIAWGWPFFAQAEELRAVQLGHFDRLGFVLGQFLSLGAGAGLWLIGLVALLMAPGLRTFRALGVLAATIFMLLLVAGGKDYYFGPVHTLLVAAAAVFLDDWLKGRFRTPVVAAGFGWLAIGGIALLPMGVPILAPSLMAQYASSLGLTRVTQTNRGTVLPLPQDYADMTGWSAQVEAVAAVYATLPPEEQATVAIVGTNYGRTGAVAALGPAFGLPYPIGWHGDFFNWGTRGRTGEVIIGIGGTAEAWRQNWDEVAEVARSENAWAVEEELSIRIFVCRRPRLDLKEVFRRLGPVWR